MNLFNKFDKIYDNFGHYFVNIIIIFHTIYFIVLFGIITINITYINNFNIFIHTFVCIFLIIRFNPLREKNHLRNHDSNIIFSIALFLLLNLSIIETIKKVFSNEIKNIDKINNLIHNNG
jgi:hypothetical protein